MWETSGSRSRGGLEERRGERCEVKNLMWWSLRFCHYLYLWKIEIEMWRSRKPCRRKKMAWGAWGEVAYVD